MADLNKYAPKLWDLEGGFVNDPDDAGGATNHGITLTSFKAYCLQCGRPEPTIEDLRHLSWDDFINITRERYWNKWQADRIINQSVAELLVDWTYNSGSFGIKIPQRLLGLDDDGIVGNVTIKAVNAADQPKLFTDLWTARKGFYESIVMRNPSQEKFLKGWMNRLNMFEYKEN